MRRAADVIQGLVVDLRVSSHLDFELRGPSSLALDVCLQSTSAVV